ncbi:hypothetical protein GCM10027161_78910 [Microbispora hainanensis]
MVAAARNVGAELKETGAIAVQVDLSTPEGPAHLVERAVAELGEDLDLLVNNVGGGDPGVNGVRDSSASRTTSGSRGSTSTSSPPSARPAPRCPGSCAAAA